ncbi:MAG: LytTR family DNA-binding domain-containing protein [Blastocatellia bacterium]|nr:LytTR family DNA-binding domain-containing protein [Blastocatellia bacterium]
MRILIVDDEMPARGELRYILGMIAPDAIVFEATNGIEALDLIEREPIDVVFLDINMPGMNGLTVAAQILDGPQPPLVVFATAYDDYALQAFQLAALDYVVKPFDERRLQQTVERITQTLQERALLAQRHSSLREFLHKSETPMSGLKKLWAERADEVQVLVDFQDIAWVEAEEKMVYICTAMGEKLAVRYTLKDLETRLSGNNFVRVHKGYIVNLNYIGEVVTWFSGSYVIRLTDRNRTEIPMSRRYAAQLKKETGLH